MRETNFENRYYKLYDHIIVIGTLKMRDLSRFMMTLINKEGIANFPKILIIGDKRMRDTDLEMLIKNTIFHKKIYYLSVEDGIDSVAYKKANLIKAKAVYFLSHLNIDS